MAVNVVELYQPATVTCDRPYPRAAALRVGVAGPVCAARLAIDSASLGVGDMLPRKKSRAREFMDVPSESSVVSDRATMVRVRYPLSAN